MRTRFLGLPMDLLTREQVRDAAIDSIERRKPLLHGSLNALKVVQARRDPNVMKLLESFDLVTPDGMSVVWGLRLLGQGRAQQVAGVDLMADLLSEGARRKWRFFMLGARPEIASMLPERVERLYPGVKVVGAQHGYFSAGEQSAIAASIRASGADVLLVGMPSPVKERFLFHQREATGVPFSMGVGGGLDLLAGRTRRAPRWMRKMGLEWLYRVMQEPRRLAGRYFVTNLRFAGLLALELLSSRRSRRVVSC